MQASERLQPRSERAIRRFPDANLAIVPSGDMIVLDVDGDLGRATFENLNLADTGKALTSRGFHAYYRKQGDFPDKMAKLNGIDIKAGGSGYIVVPPSVHTSGHEYAWDKNQHVAPLRYEEIGPREAALKSTVLGRPLTIEKGGRNSTLTSFAGWLRYKGLGDNQLLRVLKELNAAVCSPPIIESELANIARSIGKYPTDHEEAFGNLADVVEQELRWLAYPYWVRGAVNVIEGNPGDGKSTFVVAIASAVSKRAQLPFVDKLGSGRVLVLSAEDDPARVLKPRFLVHGADLERIRFQQKPFTLDGNGLGLLRSEIEAHQPRLVIIDPLIAYMDASVDLHRANDTMQFMNELDQLARSFDTTMLIVRHLRKGDSGDPLYRGLGSIGIAARVRSIMLLGRHPEEPDVRALAHVKSNYAPPGPTILFDLDSAHDGRPPKIRWLGTDQQLAARRPAEPTTS
jgi:AAA domain-containing protein/bifunctional DNA primase/polymerase-like protein/primase-like protein